jgi:hypothetical protein
VDYKRWLFWPLKTILRYFLLIAVRVSNIVKKKLIYRLKDKDKAVIVLFKDKDFLIIIVYLYLT